MTKLGHYNNVMDLLESVDAPEDVLVSLATVFGSG